MHAKKINSFWTDWTKGDHDDCFDNPCHRRLLPLLPRPYSRSLLCPGHLQVSVLEWPVNSISKKVHLWSRPRGHLHDNLQPVAGIRRCVPQDTFWNPDRDPIRPWWPGGGPCLMGRGASMANSLPRSLRSQPPLARLLVATTRVTSMVDW